VHGIVCTQRVTLGKIGSLIEHVALGLDEIEFRQKDRST
jgi:hypothetical protein